MSNYIVQLPEFHVEAESPQEAAMQAIQTFQDYMSSRNCFVRQFGAPYGIRFNPEILEETPQVEEC